MVDASDINGDGKINYFDHINLVANTLLQTQNPVMQVRACPKLNFAPCHRMHGTIVFIKESRCRKFYKRQLGLISIIPVLKYLSTVTFSKNNLKGKISNFFGNFENFLEILNFFLKL